MAFRKFLFLLLLLICAKAYCQQDVDFHLNAHLLPGKKILKVKRDFYDPYLWVLAQNNEVYRVNSLTLAVDDYTAQFSAYGNLQFIDIAGRSQDTVFVATNSNDLLEYKKGILKVISQNDGMTGTLNQVGMDHIYDKAGKTTNEPLFGKPLLMIATTTNIYYYDCINEIIYPSGVDPANNRLFETTYRTEAYSDLGFTGYYDPVKQFETIDRTSYTVYEGALWYNTPEFGYKINTAYYVTSGFAPYNYNWDDPEYMSQIWGTEKGLFQNNWDFSFDLTSQYQHYLDGININKVTSIYGLINFSSLIRENLLVGTDQGLYFSSSGYQKYTAGPTFEYNTFTHDDEIGTQVINDICVNATSYSKTLCEDGAWVAADDGLYLIKPDYGKYLNSTNLQAISFQNQSATLSDLKLCAGDAATAVINTWGYTGNIFQWYKNGAELPAQNKNTLTIKTAGDYYAVLYDPCGGIHMESNHLSVEMISSPVFSFNYPDKIQQCDNTPLTLQTDDNPGYQYRWYTNGVLNGSTGPSFEVTQTGKYKVEVSACSNSWVPSKEVEVDMITLPVPQISADKAVYCAEDVATLSANVPTDPGYTINWYRANTLLPQDINLTAIKETTAGNYTVTLSSNTSPCTQNSSPMELAFTPTPVFTFNYPDEMQYCDGTPVTLQAAGSPNYQYRWYKDGALTGDATASLPVTQAGKYKVEVSACAGSWVASKEVQVNFVVLPVPVIVPDKPAYCIGDAAGLSIFVVPDPSYTIEWFRDNTLLAGNNNSQTLVTSTPGNYTVSVVNKTANTDGSTCTQTSAAQAIVFNPPPTVSIEKIVQTTLCDGQTIGLLAQYNGGTVKWSTGETTDQISVNTAGNYTATVTSPAGCQSQADITIAFFSNPVFSVNDTTICTYKNQTITLTAPSGFAAYAWNGAPGGQTFDVTRPQTVSLTVTDANGCQATRQIKVVDQCPDIYIPNTFTPNGDGINDTWVIEGLDNDPTALVRVFTRYGSQIFESKGYGTPWDGEYDGKKLPAGVYYYIVTAKQGSQKFSGALTIVY